MKPLMTFAFILFALQQSFAQLDCNIAQNSNFTMYETQIKNFGANTSGWGTPKGYHFGVVQTPNASTRLSHQNDGVYRLRADNIGTVYLFPFAWKDPNKACSGITTITILDNCTGLNATLSMLSCQSTYGQWTFTVPSNPSGTSYQWSVTNGIINGSSSSNILYATPSGFPFSITLSVSRYGCTKIYSRSFYSQDCNSPNEQLQANPNPFQGMTLIKYKIPERGQFVLNLLDGNGVLIKTLVNEKLDYGEYEMELDNREFLQNGLYFIQGIINGKLMENKRILKNE